MWYQNTCKSIASSSSGIEEGEGLFLLRGELRVPTPGVEVRIGDNGEVYYRSPGTFVEYYKNPESTADTKDPEGWVATGDAGFFEEDTGHLRIIDRAKDVAKMSDGSMFAPKYVENKLKGWSWKFLTF